MPQRNQSNFGDYMGLPTNPRVMPFTFNSWVRMVPNREPDRRAHSKQQREFAGEVNCRAAGLIC